MRERKVSRTAEQRSLTCSHLTDGGESGTRAVLNEESDGNRRSGTLCNTMLLRVAEGHCELRSANGSRCSIQTGRCAAGR